LKAGLTPGFFISGGHEGQRQRCPNSAAHSIDLPYVSHEAESIVEVAGQQCAAGPGAIASAR
jgi:hypothetical protein